MAKRAGRVQVGSIGLWVKQVTGQKQVILSGLKMGSGQLGCGSGWVDSYFLHEFIYLFIFKFL